MPKKLLTYYVLFAISGFCGLIYESIWTKYLRLFLGHAAYAQTVVLIVFIGGMAAGAWLCGRFSERIRKPLLVYAGAELLVGICAIGFHPLYDAATSWAYDHLLPVACSTTGLCYASWAFAALLILPQSILLGSTFPLMTAGILRIYGEAPGRKIALLYFLNSIGAVVGVLTSTFVLVPLVGLPGASLTAGILNVALALAVYVISRLGVEPASVVPSAPPEVVEQSRLPRLLLWVAALTGLSSFVYEIVWIRLLSLVLGASTHAFEIMLASFIFGLAMGGLWIRRRIDTLERPIVFLGYVQIIMGILATLTIPLANQSFDGMAWLLGALARDDSGYVLFNIGSAVIAAAIMSPPTFLAGMTLPLITYSLYRGKYREGSVGMVYSANTLGSIVGVILAVHFALPLLGLKGSLVTAAGIDVALGIALLALARDGRGMIGTFAWPVAGIAGVLVASIYFVLDPMKTASGVFRLGTATLPPDIRILFHRDGKTATVDVLGSPDGTVAIRTNGKTDAAIQMRSDAQAASGDEDTMTLLAALPLAHVPDVRTVAIVGFGSGMTTSMVLADRRIQRVDTIEIEPAMIEGATNFLPLVERAFRDPRSRLVIDDAKSYFARNQEKYDIIISEPSNPWVSGVASLFTEEFYLRARRYLNAGGIFAQWIHVYEFDPALLGSVTTALGAVFPDFDAYIANEGDLILIARNGGAVGAPSERIFDEPELRVAMARIGIDSVADIQSRRIIGKRLLHSALFRGAGSANSDYFPYVDLNAPRARFKQATAGSVVELALAPIPVLEMLEARPLQDRGDLAIPKNARSAIVQRNVTAQRLLRALSMHSADRTIPSVEGVSSTEVAVLRLAFVECASEPSVAAVWDEVLQFAEVVNPGLPRSSADRLWASYQSSPCLDRLPARYRTWLALFKAVGQRDPAAMSALAEGLLEQRDNTARQIEYLVLAAATGYLAENRLADAKRLLSEALTAMPPVVRDKRWFVLERQLAGL